jgi:methyltransferase (TIGR00027 family)
MSRVMASTAFSVSVQRAVHRRLDPPPHILDDELAWTLLSADERRLVSENPRLFESSLARHLRRRVLLRQRYAEDALEAAVARGFQQYVILGAGLDTFCVRQPAWARGLRVFELDRAGEQAGKQARMRAAELALPGNVRLVPADFERSDWFDGLVGAGFDPSAPSFFSCLGVLVYLSEAAIDRLLATPIRSSAPAELVFTTSTDAKGGPDQLFARAAAARGEAWLNTLPASEVCAKLRQLGYADLRQVSAAELARGLVGPEAAQPVSDDGSAIFHVSTHGLRDAVDRAELTKQGAASC